jgi:hypothetical protein
LKLAIIGSRGFNNVNLLNESLLNYLFNVTLVVSGGARGADKMGEEWAKRYGIDTLIFPADWETHGKAAGFIRNEDIIKNCDEAIAFWDQKSKGTLHSINLAKKLEKPIKIISF